VRRLLSSLLITLLGVWPTRAAAPSAARPRRARRLPSRPGPTDDQDPVESPERARARTMDAHQWPGELVVHAGAERTVTSGQWRLTTDPHQRAQPLGAAQRLSLDPAYPEGWATDLEALLTLQHAGARLAVRQADATGWQQLELRAPTRPETVVQLDRAAVAQLFGCAEDALRVELQVRV
jgi:hypothetical protein